MKDFFSLQGKIAVVTGAGRGLGQGIALRLAAAGATVGVNDLDAFACKRVVERIVKDDGRAFAMPGNVVDETTMTNLFGFVHTAFGGVDILVNNAGVSVSEDIFEMSIENWRNVLDINLLGAVIGSKLALEQMRNHGRGGRIIMIGSMVAHQGAVRGWVHYGASKSGLHGLGKTLARTAARFGVTVNNIAPGIIETELLQQSHGAEGVHQLLQQVPLARLGTPDDVAAAVHFLASSDAAYITGATIDVTGGMYIRA